MSAIRWMGGRISLVMAVMILLAGGVCMAGKGEERVRGRPGRDHILVLKSKSAGDILGKAVDHKLESEDIKRLAEIVSEKVRSGMTAEEAAEKAKAIVSDRIDREDVVRGLREWAADVVRPDETDR